MCQYHQISITNDKHNKDKHSSGTVLDEIIIRGKRRLWPMDGDCDCVVYFGSSETRVRSQLSKFWCVPD